MFLSFPPPTKMFQFRGLASVAGCWIFYPAGCPIQKSPDQILFANPRSFSQLTTSFFASKSLGIPHTPLFTFLQLPTRPIDSVSELYLISSNMSMYVTNFRPFRTALGSNLRLKRCCCNVSLK